jgi:hypothetical protein
MNSEIRVVGLGQALLRKGLSALTGLVVVVAMGIAADYAIGPVQAGTLDASASSATSPETLAASPAATVPTRPRADSSVADNSPSADIIAPAAHAIGPDPGKGFERLPGHVIDALAKANVVDTAAVPASAKASSAGARHEPLTLTFVLKRDDQVGFERYLHDVSDSSSPEYQHFLRQAQLAQRFGPSGASYQSVLSYLRKAGFSVKTRAKNRMTITATATRAIAERAFSLHINDYRLGSTRFYTNDYDPALPASVAARVQAISGLSNLGEPHRVVENFAAICEKYHVSELLEGGGLLKLLFFDLAETDLAFLAIGVTAAAPEAVATAGIVATGVASCYVIENWAAYAKKHPNPKDPSLPPILRGFGLMSNWPAFGKALVGLQQAHHTSAGRVGTSSADAATTSSSVIYPDGVGQTVGLLEFDTFNTSDVSDFIDYISETGGYAGNIANLSVKAVNGGVATPGAGEAEVLLDIDTVMSLAPGAKVVVYDAPFNGQTASYSALFNAMINDGVTVISNSWASCEDQVSVAEAQGIDSILKTAAASGISVFNGAGDSGSSCLDGSPNTVAVPADSPSATAVGGTSVTFGQDLWYGSETWWDGSASVPVTGQGGFGVSKYFARPSYQAGLTTSTMRSVPDVVAAADPAAGGMKVCQADNGGCPSGDVSGGTSLATPIWAAYAALLNEAEGKQHGAFNPLLYPLANSAGFHNAASMGSDFAHVGLGSPDLNVIGRMLAGDSVGTPDANWSTTDSLLSSNLSTSSQTSAGFIVGVAADGASQAGVLVTLRDNSGLLVSGKTVTLASSAGSATITPAGGVTTDANGTALFTLTDLTPETLTLSATDATDGVSIAQTASLTFTVPQATGASITANPSTVAADGQSAATLTVTLKDSLGRAAAGKIVTVSDAGAHAVISGPTAGVTDANGQIQFTATDDINETVTFSAVDVTDGNLAIPGSGTVTYSGSTTTACGVGTVPVAGTGYTVTPYITGVPAAANLYYGGSNIGCPGADNPAFTSAGEVLTADFLNGNIYQTSLSGGAVSTSNLLSTLSPALGGLVYGKDGSAYATVGNEGAEIIQVDPTTGAQLRVVASNLTCPAGLSVDPLSGDLFFDDECTGGGTDNASIFRVIDPANTDTSKPTSVVVYATLPATPNGGMAFAPNGTLYAVSGYYVVADAPVEQISGTNATTVTVNAVTGITASFGVALGAVNADDSAQSLIVTSSAGVMSEVPIASPSTPTVLISANAPNPGVTGPDGCMYAPGHETIYKIASSSGGCTFASTSPAPSISLSPATVSPNPAQGGSETFTATLKNVPTLSGVPVYFQISGANGQIKLATTDANGSAAISYTAIEAGVDTVVATATASSTALASNATQVTWTAGQHVTFVSLNSSPQGGTVNQSVTVKASVTDVSASPAVSLAGQSVTFTLGGSSCTAATNSAGIATCTLTPTAVGSAALTVSYAGSSSFTAAKASIGFNVSASPNPAPTVSISVSPTTIVAGASATLTWSSTNATSCTASGSWSGTEATSGTQSVTPAVNGSYSYTLTCTGAGGTAAATAVLTATPVAVTVTAKSGGGALSWYAVLALGLLVMLRFGAAMAGSGVLRRRGVARRTRGKANSLVGVAIVVVALSCVAARSARADQPPTGQPDGTSDPYYVGIRVGSMPLRQESSKIDQGLTSLGFPDVRATSDISGAAGTLFLGYAFTPHAALELGYTFRDSTTAHLTGTIPSSSKLTPLLQDTTELTRGYGNIVSLSYSGRFEVLPRFSLEPRLGGFFWATKDVAISLDDRIDHTHEGGGVTAGLTAAYRVWRGLELGVSVDHFRGFPNNIATLYAASLEWRFGGGY